MMEPRPPLRILIADVNRSNRELLCRELSAPGYSVDVAATAAEVILFCEADPPDVLILDVHLPDMDGFELCEHVRRETRGADLTLIILTEPNDELTRGYLGPMVDFVGGDYFCAKPCDAKLLLTLLNELAEGRRRDSGKRRGGFPTHVVWPTSHGRPTAALV